jgi:hypothetical protein
VAAVTNGFAEMPIPESNSEGLLPSGLFDCELPEVRVRFGVFRDSDRRPQLFARLDELARAMRLSGLFEELIIDGSFVTSKDQPNDIGLIAILRAGHNFARDLPVSEYALVSRALLRRRFGFDVVVVERDSGLYRTYLEFFSRVREAPELRKGLLRMRL